jgi:DNA-nicking Smr family endonuclease
MAMTDEELFLASMGDVIPLAKNNQADLDRIKAEPTIAQLEKRKAAEEDRLPNVNVLSSEYVDLLHPHDILAFKKPGVQEGVYKKLRLGKYQIDATIDLHGLRFHQARNALFEFIVDCHAGNIRSLLLRHGIGLNSKPVPAILKSYINKWLKELPEVLCFHSALRCHGGNGSTYVLLKKSDEQKIRTKEINAKR